MVDVGATEFRKVWVECRGEALVGVTGRCIVCNCNLFVGSHPARESDERACRRQANSAVVLGSRPAGARDAASCLVYFAQAALGHLVAATLADGTTGAPLPSTFAPLGFALLGGDLILALEALVTLGVPTGISALLRVPVFPQASAHQVPINVHQANSRAQLSLKLDAEPPIILLVPRGDDVTRRDPFLHPSDESA